MLEGMELGPKQLTELPVTDDAPADQLVGRAWPTDSPSGTEVNEALLQAERLDCSLRRYYVDEFFTRYASRFKSGSQVLDLGGQRFPKRGQFNIERYDVHVCYANLSKIHRPHVQTDAATLPFKGETFDVAICAELLEHAPDPRPILREVHRVLRHEGVMLVTVPFLFPIHADPYDYARYTDNYWRQNLRQIGFEDITVEEQGLFWSVAVDMARAWLHEKIRQGRTRSELVQRVGRVLMAQGKRWALRRERETQRGDHTFLRRYTTGYGIRVVRP